MNSAIPGIEIFDLAIVGAGVSGLAARREASRLGLSSIVLEKSRGLGGRCATRRGPDWVADLGAQFTSLELPSFRAALKDAGPDLRRVGRSERSENPR